MFTSPDALNLDSVPMSDQILPKNDKIGKYKNYQYCQYNAKLRVHFTWCVKSWLCSYVLSNITKNVKIGKYKNYKYCQYNEPIYM